MGDTLFVGGGGEGGGWNDVEGGGGGCDLVEGEDLEVGGGGEGLTNGLLGVAGLGADGLPTGGLFFGEGAPPPPELPPHLNLLQSTGRAVSEEHSLADL